MTFISVFRLAIFSLSLLLSLAILGFTAHLLNISTEQIHFVVFPDFEAVSVVAASLSIISLALFVIVGAIRKGSFFNMIVVEFTTIVVLWVLWIVVAARTADWWVALGCNVPDNLNSLGVMFCHETVAIEGLSFLIWIILLIFLLTLIVYIIIGKSRGNTIWTVSIAEATFFSPPLPTGRRLATGDIGQPQKLQLSAQTLGNIGKFQLQLPMQPHAISIYVQHQRYECPPSAGLQAMNYPLHSDRHNFQMMPQV